MEEQGRWEKVEERRWSGESGGEKVAWMGHGEGVGGEGGGEGGGGRLEGVDCVR